MGIKSIISNAYLEDIGDAIRQKRGTEETYYPSQMGDAIRGIEGIVPSGTINIDTDGTYDVTQYAEAVVETDIEELRQEYESAVEISGCDPLSEGLDALLTNANETTGSGDTTLSDAITTLADGYGGYTLEDIAEGAIRNIEEVTIKSTIIETYTFSDSRFKIIHLPNAVTINGRPFNGISALEVIDIPNVKNIGGAFYSCSNLSGSYGEEAGVLRLPKVVTANNFAFYNSKIQKVYFMTTASYLEKSVFYNCSKLTDIYVPWSEGEVAGAPWSNNQNVVVHYNTVYDENGEPII